MAALVRTVLRGLALPDPRIDSDAYDASRSTVTQAGPQPGQAVPSVDTSAVLTATGTQSAGGSLEFFATSGGMPGLDAARTVWRNTGDARYRGWEVPQTISGFDYPAYTTTAGLQVDPCILRLASDGVLIAFEHTTAGQVRLRRRSATASTWISSTIYTHPGGVYASGARPCMVQLPSGRVLLFHCVETTGSVNLGMRYSDDDGANWTAGQLFCLASPISTATASVRRLRAAYYGGQIVLMVDIRDTSTAYYRRLAQYASADLGATFQAVTQLAGTSEATHAAFPDVAATSTGFVLTYVRYASDVTYGNRVRAYSRRIGSAYAIFSVAGEVALQDVSNPMAWGTYSAGDITAGDMALCADDVGRVYAFGRDLSAAGYDDGAVRYTDDDGDTWSGTGSSSHQTTKAMWWRGTDASTAPRAFAATWQRGRALLATQHDSSGTTADASISLIVLGGYSAHALPSLTGPITHDTMSAWEATYLPFDLPEATGTNWTAAPTGTPTITLDSTGLVTSGGAGDVASWYATPSGTMAEGVIAEVWVAVTTGVASLEVRAGVAGPDSFRAGVTVTPTAIALVDEESATTIATISTVAGATGVWIRLAVGCAAVSGNNGRCAAYWAPGARGDVDDRNFTEIGTSTALVQGTNTTHRVTFRATTTGVAFNIVHRWVAYTSGAYAGTNSLSGYTGNASPGDLLGRDLTARDAYVADGLSIRGDDGPAYRGDAWTVATSYRYPINAVHYDEQPSPRRTWRSTTDASDAIIAWTVNPTAATVSPAPNLARVVYLGGINFCTARFEGLNSAGIFVTIATIDAASGATGLGFTRADTMITPTYIGTAPPSSGIARMLVAGELVGARFASGANVRRITWSGPGIWPGGPLASGAPARFTVTSGTGISATAKDGQIWFPNVAMVLNDTTSTEYSAYRLVIPAQTTAEGYFEVGIAMVGYLHAFGQQYSANRSQEIAPAYELTEGRGGTRRVQTTGPARRAVEVAWDEGVDASDLASSTGDDYVEGYVGGGALGSPADVVPSMLGVLNQLGGAATPCVYLPRVPVVSGATTTTTINAPPLLMYGRIMTETLRMDTIQGDEYERPGEVYRLARVRIEEEL
jgi:hypothetical protein